MGNIERDRIAEALAEAAFTGQLPALEDEGTGAVERARVVVDFVLDLANHRGAVEALRPFADFADRMDEYQGESPLWAVIDECRAARDVLHQLGG